MHQRRCRPTALGRKNWLFAGIRQAGGIMLLFITSRLTGFGSAILRMWTAGRWFARASVSFLMVSII